MKFKADTKDLKRYRKFFKKMPDRIAHTISSTLNTQAFETQKHIPDVLNQAFTIRDERFMKRQLQVNMASKSGSIAGMFSEVGSKEAKGFTGWEEQQTGQASDKERVASEAARSGGAFKGKMKRGARLRSGAPVRKASDYQGTKKRRTFAMLHETRKQKLPFMIQRTDYRPGNIAAGLYEWKGKKLFRLQKFDTPYKPKRVDWMGKSVKRMVAKRGPFDQVFEAEMERIIRKYGR